MERNWAILTLAAAIEAVFDESDWKELGYATGTDQYISSHKRLLRSLSWRDSDYGGHVKDAVARMLDKSPENAGVIFANSKVNDWLRTSAPQAYDYIQAEFAGQIVAPPELSRFQVAQNAIHDAELLISQGKPASAVDRVHTAIHAFLRECCQDASLQTNVDATANQLLKTIIKEHPRLAALGTRAENVRTMLRGAGGIIDSLGTIRNNASLAHPNETLLGDDEARLAINLASTLLWYLNSKL